MKNLVFIMFIIFSNNFASSQSLTIQTYSWENAPPWAHTEILPDSVKVNYEIKQLDSIEYKIIRGYDRMADNEKGPNYFEWKFLSDKNGFVRLDLSQLKEGEIFYISAKKDKYISIWQNFRFSKKLDLTRWKGYMIHR